MNDDVDLQRAGEAVVTAAGELVRAWRAARLEAWPDVFPGHADALVEPLLVEAGTALARGEDPALAFDRTAGLVRLTPRDPAGALARLDAELHLLADLTERACASLPAGELAGRAIARAVEHAASRLRAGERPPGVLAVGQLSALRPRGRGA